MADRPVTASLAASTWVEEEARPGLGSPPQGPHSDLLDVGPQVARLVVRLCLEVVAKLKAMVLIRVRKAL